MLEVATCVHAVPLFEPMRTYATVTYPPVTSGEAEASAFATASGIPSSVPCLTVATTFASSFFGSRPKRQHCHFASPFAAVCCSAAVVQLDAFAPMLAASQVTGNGIAFSAPPSVIATSCVTSSVVCSVIWVFVFHAFASSVATASPAAFFTVEPAGRPT